MPVTRPPIEGGAVAVRAGVITAVAPAREISGDRVEDLGDVVLVPGFVNAHTHFELSHLAGRISTDRGYVPWVEGLARVLRAGGDAGPLVGEAVRSAVRQSLAAGVTTVGDITRRPESVRPLLAKSALRVVSFGEVLGIGRLRAEFLAKLTAAIDSTAATDGLRIGLSPHAPYTVEPDGLRLCARRAREAALPLCIHVAETPDEEAFTTARVGPLREYLERLGVWDDAVPCPGLRPVELLSACGLLGPRTLLAHANYVSDDDIRRIAEAGASVAYCPRTHAAFGHPPHRFRDMLAAGIPVCIGTDSLASNPSLSVLDELRHLHRVHPDVPASTLLAMGTCHGAQALDWNTRVGSLEPGEDADFVLVTRAADGPADPVANVLASTTSPRATHVFGEPVAS
ncbi:MAG: amidohydrolase family protein [Phycisphaerae bacterium]|nr:amidohydrolase family protein [Phycisphaerae bacterium]